MARRKKQSPLPAEGAAFATPLEDGRFGACRVIRMTTDDEAKKHGAASVLVASSEWIGDAAPDAQDPALRPILFLTHHSWDNKPAILWVSDPVPDDFVSIGTIESTAKEKAIECLAHGGWASAQIQPLAQWRWDNDRDAVLANDSIKAKAESQTRHREQKERQAYLEAITLESLLDHHFFPQWDGYTPKKAILASRRIMKDTVQKLLDIGQAAPEAERMAILQDCIERFNASDAEMDHFIETVEREDICEEFEAIVHACGLGAHEDVADNWRDW